MGQQSRPAPQRVFIVGCPRSGTTFLQNSLAAHPAVLSLPETTYFDRILNTAGRWIAGDDTAPAPRPFGFARGRTHRCAPGALRELAEQLGVAVPQRLWHWSIRGYVDHFVTLLDAGAAAHGRSAWIEKSPIHIAFIDTIEQHVPDALFVHVLRNGEDVIASIVDAGLRYNAFDRARGFNQWIPHWVNYWNRAMDTHLKHAGRARHCFVCQEDLVENFRDENRRLQRFLGLDPTARGHQAALAVSNTEIEPWKTDAVSGTPKTPERKFEALFGPQLQRWLRGQLRRYEPIRAQLAQAQGLPPKFRPPLALSRNNGSILRR